MDYSQILKKAWQIIWKHKVLWLFGILASCGTASSQGGNNFRLMTHGGGSPGQSGSASAFPLFNTPMKFHFDSFMRTIETVEPWVWILIVFAGIFIGVTLSIAFLFLGTLGTTGVIKGTSLADAAEKDDKPLSFAAIFKALKPYYWKVLLLNLGLQFLGFFVFLFLAIPIVLLTICTCGIGLFLLIPIGWFIELMITFTTIAIIEEDRDIIQGMSRAWQVISQKLGYVVVMFLILGIGQFIIGLIIGLPLILIPIPLLINLIATGFRTVGVGLIVSIFFSVFIIPFAVFLGGVVKAYVLASWTLTFRRLTSPDELNPTVLPTEDEEPVESEQPES